MNKPNGEKNVTFGDLKNILRDLYYNNNIAISKQASTVLDMLQIITYTGAINNINRVYILDTNIVDGSDLFFYQGGKVDRAEYSIVNNQEVTFIFIPQEDSTLEFYGIPIT